MTKNSGVIIKLNVSQVELNKFIGMAAHDIRNPVGSIKMIAEMYLTSEKGKGSNFYFLLSQLTK